MGSDQLHLLLQPLDSGKDSRTTNRERAAPIRAASLRRGIRVAMHNQDIIYRDTKLLSNDLGKRCLFSLAVWRRTGVDHYGTTLLNSYARTLIQTNRRGPLGPKAADLNIRGDADAHQLALGTFSGLLSTQIPVVHDRQGLIQSLLVFTGVIHRPGSRLVRELIRLDEVDSTHPHRILAQLMCHHIHYPLRDVGRLRTARPSIGICGSLIRKDDISTEMDVFNVVSTTRHRVAEGNHNHICEELGVCTQVRDAIHLHSRYLAIPGRSSLHIVNLVAPVDRGCQSFAAILNPLDGTP